MPVETPVVGRYRSHERDPTEPPRTSTAAAATAGTPCLGPILIATRSAVGRTVSAKRWTRQIGGTWRATPSSRSVTSRASPPTTNTRRRLRSWPGPGVWCRPPPPRERAKGKGRATFNDFNFTHLVDKASPNLMLACATGEHVNEATLTVRKAGKGPQEYLIVKMADVIVTGVHPSGSGGAMAWSRCSACSAPRSIWKYKPQKADGSLEGGYRLRVRHEGQQAVVDHPLVPRRVRCGGLGSGRSTGSQR